MKQWVLEYEPATPQEIEPLMGWTSSNDMLSQVRLFFETKEEAIDYAQKNGIPFRTFEPPPLGASSRSPTATTSSSAASGAGRISFTAQRRHGKRRAAFCSARRSLRVALTPLGSRAVRRGIWRH
jgi:hypothetical protein